MEYPSLNYLCRQTPHLDPRSSHHHSQGDLFHPDASGLHDLNAAGTLNPATHFPPGSTNVNLKLKDGHSLRIEETRGRKPSRQSVSRTSIKSSLTSYQHSPSQSHVVGLRNVSNQDDQSLERRTYEEHRQLFDILGLQSPVHNRNHFTNTSPVSGPAPQGPGHGQDLPSDTLYSDHENVGYAAHPLQPPDPIFDANPAGPPTLSSTNVAEPLHLTNAGDQDLSWRRQFEAYAHGIFPDSVLSQRTAHGRNWPTDTAPFISHPSQATGYGQDLASDTSRLNDESVCYAAHPLQPFPPFLESDSAAAPPVLDPSYNSAPVDVSPKLKSEYYEYRGTPSASHISATHRPAPILSNHINSRLLGTSNPSRRPYKVSKLNCSETSAENPIPRRRRRQRRLLPQQPHFSGVDLCFPASRPHVATSESVNPSGAPTQGQPNDNTAKTECSESSNVSNETDCSEPSNVSNEDEVDFDFYLDMKALIEEPPKDCQISSLNALDTLNLIDQDVPDAQESTTAQDIAGQPIGNTSLEQQPQPKRRYRKRNLPTAFPTTASQAQQPQTKPRKKTNPNPVRKNPSCKTRRADPTFRYWCAEPTCHASRACGFKGFVTCEDTRRHLLVHEAPSFACWLPHKNGGKFRTRRKDNFAS